MKWSYVDPALPLLVYSWFAWLAWSWRGLAPSRRWTGLGLAAALFLLTTPTGSRLLALPLIEGSPEMPRRETGARAIMVLAGGVLSPTPELPAAISLTDTTARTEKAAFLYNQWKPLPILACGGRLSDAPDATTFSEVMAEILRRRGVPESEIWLERRSTSTYENVKFGAEILRAKGVRRVVLVTSTLHMKRARRALEAQGIEVRGVTPNWPPRPAWEVKSWIPSSDELSLSQQAIHEYGGLLLYAAMGWI